MVCMAELICKIYSIIGVYDDLIKNIMILIKRQDLKADQRTKIKQYAMYIFEVLVETFVVASQERLHDHAPRCAQVCSVLLVVTLAYTTVDCVCVPVFSADRLV